MGRFPAGILCLVATFFVIQTAAATTKGLSQIVTPDLQQEGDLSLSFQAQSERIANPYQLQAELGLTKWAEIAVFEGFKPNEVIMGTELGLIQRAVSAGGICELVAASHVDPQLPSRRVITWSTRNSSWAPFTLTSQ